MENKLIIGLLVVCLTYSAWLIFQSASLSISGKRVMATCDSVEVLRRSGRQGQIVYHLRFSDESGVVHKATARPSPFWPNPGVGERVRVLYRPANPKKVFPDSLFGIWIIPGAVTLVSALFLAKVIADKYHPD